MAKDSFGNKLPEPVFTDPKETSLDTLPLGLYYVWDGMIKKKN